MTLRTSTAILIGVILVSASSLPAADAPFGIRPGLFDASRPTSLGLERIPAKHAMLYRATSSTYRFCHHPNLVVYGDRLYCMWSNGKIGEDEPGQRILFSSTVTGEHWSEPRQLASDPGGRGACVAAGWVVAGRRLVAFYTITGGTNFHPDTALWAQTSSDASTWSRPRRITEGFFIAAPIALPGGGLLLAGEHVGDARKSGRMRLLVTKALDGLSRWTPATIDIDDPKVFGYTEPAPYVLPSGVLISPFRNYSGALYASLSRDRGRTWSRPARTNFPDSLARHATGRLPDGQYFLVNNPSSKRLDRSILTIALSRDGRTYDRAWVVRNEPTVKRFDGKSKLDGWQYPHALARGKHLVVAYSINKEDVAVSRIPLAALRRDRR